jgi:hypothetical protein
MGFKVRRHRRVEAFPRPWYAHEDRWELAVRRECFRKEVVLLVEPKRSCPVFGPSVEVRVLEDGFEVYVASHEDDGRFVVPMDRAELRRLVGRLRARKRKGGFLVTGAPRRLTGCEENFLLRAAARALCDR